MWQKNHRKSKKACVPRKKFEEEPEYIHSMTTMTMAM